MLLGEDRVGCYLPNCGFYLKIGPIGVEIEPFSQFSRKWTRVSQE